MRKFFLFIILSISTVIAFPQPGDSSEIIKKQMQLEFERKVREDSIRYAEKQIELNAKLQQQQEKLETLRGSRRSIGISFLVIIVFAVLILIAGIVILVIKLRK
jgi:hypothetical protein